MATMNTKRISIFGALFALSMTTVLGIQQDGGQDKPKNLKERVETLEKEMNAVRASLRNATENHENLRRKHQELLLADSRGRGKLDRHLNTYGQTIKLLHQTFEFGRGDVKHVTIHSNLGQRGNGILRIEESGTVVIGKAGRRQEKDLFRAGRNNWDRGNPNR